MGVGGGSLLYFTEAFIILLTLKYLSYMSHSHLKVRLNL